jgi:hypothetical protein
MLLRSMPVMRRAGSARGDHADITRMSCVSASLRVPRLSRLSGRAGWGGSGTQAQIWACTGNSNQSWSLP